MVQPSGLKVSLSAIPPVGHDQSVSGGGGPHVAVISLAHEGRRSAPIAACWVEERD